MTYPGLLVPGALDMCVSTPVIELDEVINSAAQTMVAPSVFYKILCLM